MSAAWDVVSTLSAARRGVQLYPPTHPAFADSLTALVNAVNAATRTGALVINWHQGHLYHDSSVIPGEIHGAVAIAEAFEDRRIESLTFHPVFCYEDAAALTDVLSARPTPEFDIIAALAERSVTGVAAAQLADASKENLEERNRQRQSDRALYHRTIAALEALQGQFLARGTGDLAGTSDLVGQVIQRLMADQSAMVALTTIQGGAEQGLLHSLHVMIYSLALGQRLGLPEEGLASLGMCALLHDIGKSAFDGSPEQAEAMRTMHPEVGAEILQRVALEDPAPMLVAYEHHMGANGSGWPARAESYVSHPYSRMVAVADRYDNLVTGGAEREPLTPDRAMVDVLRDQDGQFEPFFTRLFANALGVFPVGCVVRLSDHSVGVVARLSEDPLAPVVRLAFDGEGCELGDLPDVDLSIGGTHITEVLSPEALDLTVDEAL